MCSTPVQGPAGSWSCQEASIHWTGRRAAGTEAKLALNRLRILKEASMPGSKEGSGAWSRPGKVPQEAEQKHDRRAAFCIGSKGKQQLSPASESRVVHTLEKARKMAWVLVMAQMAVHTRKDGVH